MMRPLAIDLFCGLGGWTEGLLAEGYRVVGFDIERHVYGDHAYPAQLVLQDVTTLHGSQFKDAALIVASPPCQEYSYMAMPWTRAKAKAVTYRAHPETQDALTLLFHTCFRLQAEAIAAAGHHIPLVVENVKGAQPWVGKAAWNYGSFYLWGDVPALMPPTVKGQKGIPHHPTGHWTNAAENGGVNYGTGSWFAIADSKNRGSKNTGGSWFNIGSPGQKETGRNPVTALAAEHHSDEDGRKVGGDWFSDPTPPSRTSGSKSNARKRASAMIAKIPRPLSCHIAKVYHP